MKKLMFLGVVALFTVFFSCQKDAFSVLNNAPQDALTADDRGGHHHGDPSLMCDSMHHHLHDSLHIHHDSLHVHDSLHIHFDSLHIHHDSIHIDTTGHGGGHGGHGGHGGPGHHGHGG